MTREQIIEEVVWLLDRQLGSGMGSIHQEPYKGDVFKLFAEAYTYCISAFDPYCIT